jgi:hypothetical protein
VAKGTGSTLSRSRVHARTIEFEVTKCPTWGAIRILLNGTVKGSFSLQSSITKRRQLVVVSMPAVQSGTVAVRVTSSGKKVEIDALGVSAK